MKCADILAFETHEYGTNCTGRNETLFTTVNGFLGLRGDYEEKDGCFHKGTYIHGFYDTEPISYGEKAYGYAENHETILNLPDPKRIALTVNGKPFSTVREGVTSFLISLDFRTGILTRTVFSNSRTSCSPSFCCRGSSPEREKYGIFCFMKNTRPAILHCHTVFSA